MQIAHTVTKPRPGKTHGAFALLENAMAIASGAIVYFMAIAVFTEVVTRFLHVGIPGIYEATELSIAASVFLALSWIQRGDHHIRLKGVILDKLEGRWRVVGALPVLLVSLAVYGLIFYASIFGTASAFSMGKHSMGLVQIPIAPFYSTMVFGCLVMIVRLLIQLKEALLDNVMPGAGGASE